MVVCTRLYEILNISPSASKRDVVKAYRINALRFHPDKNRTGSSSSSSNESSNSSNSSNGSSNTGRGKRTPSSTKSINNSSRNSSSSNNSISSSNGEKYTSEHFIALTNAYNILRDDEKRKLYDETGVFDEDGSSSSSFDDAYKYYRSMYPKFENEDIDSFKMIYINSNMETDDLEAFYIQHSGDISLIFDYIPFSELSYLDRYIQIYEKLIKTNKLPAYEEAFRSSLEKAKKNGVKYQKRIDKENKLIQDTNTNNKKTGGNSICDESDSFSSLANAIRLNQERRSNHGLSYLDMLATKYSNPNSKRQKKVSEPTDEEFEALAAKVSARKKAKSKDTQTSKKKS